MEMNINVDFSELTKDQIESVKWKKLDQENMV